jgi:hypothetical protein
MPANGVLLFGGKNAQGSLGDSWTWQNGWLEDFAGPRPPARHSHQLAIDGARGKVLLFGGKNDSGILNDTWEYDPALPRERSGERWTKLSPRNSPPARFGHRLVFDPVRGRVLLTGGSGADARVFDDVWEFDAAANTWTPLVTSVRMPARAGHVAFFDETQARITSFGGLAYRRGGEAAISYGDTWSFRTGSGSGTTRGFLPLGLRCVSATECASGLCVDGYCCNTSCSGQCAACDVPQSEGTCVAARGAPHGNRPACGGSGGDCDLQCDGVDIAACHLPNFGQTCGLASCAAGTVHFPGFCDGQGQCLFSQTQSCEPYACGAGNSCVSRCATQADCFSSAYFCYRPPFTGPGSCLPFARVVDFSAQPANPGVGVPVTLRASTNVTFARYLFSYQSGEQRVYPCGTGARDATSCTYTPTAPGSVVWRVEVDAVGSPSTGFDDSRELTLTVGP